MNSSSQRDTYLTMLNKVSLDPGATCMLVEVIAKDSHYAQWEPTIRGVKMSHPRILRLSIDRFYRVVFNDRLAFMRLCRALPCILDDVMAEIGLDGIKNSVRTDLGALSQDTLKGLFLLAFGSYEGFSQF